MARETIEYSSRQRPGLYISGKLMAWAVRTGIHIQYIQPGKSQQNAYTEQYNRTVRHEWLDQNTFETIEGAQN